jgi:hypothetical protein
LCYVPRGCALEPVVGEELGGGLHDAHFCNAGSGRFVCQWGSSLQAIMVGQSDIELVHSSPCGRGLGNAVDTHGLHGSVDNGSAGGFN